jgi:hypothetical protein
LGNGEAAVSDIAVIDKPNLGIRDFCTEEGAAEIKRRIEQFWDRREKHNRDAIKISIVKMNLEADKVHIKIFYCVRSNLVRGLPAENKP